MSSDNNSLKIGSPIEHSAIEISIGFFFELVFLSEPLSKILNLSEVKNLVTVIKTRLPIECISRIVSAPSTGKLDNLNEKLPEFTTGNTMLADAVEA